MATWHIRALLLIRVTPLINANRKERVNAVHSMWYFLVHTVPFVVSNKCMLVIEAVVQCVTSIVAPCLWWVVCSARGSNETCPVLCVHWAHFFFLRFSDFRGNRHRLCGTVSFHRKLHARSQAEWGLSENFSWGSMLNKSRATDKVHSKQCCFSAIVFPGAQDLPPNSKPVSNW